MRTLLLAAAVSFAPVALWGQEAADPRAVRPERPTVATHAWTVAPRYLELETGVEWDRNPDASHAVLTPTLLKIGIAARTHRESGPGADGDWQYPVAGLVLEDGDEHIEQAGVTGAGRGGKDDIFSPDSSPGRGGCGVDTRR